MTKGRKLSDSEQARLDRQAEKLRANLARRKAQQRARRQETQGESSSLPDEGAGGGGGSDPTD
ncbi:MAG: hypothetical protein R8L07_21650 [Alphaproteobacteria bacterium]|nr:hypothetical protein [Alphaproteobacteria bacterium]